MDRPNSPSDTDSVEAVLAHYGVSGMKWGVRRKSKGSKFTSADAKGANRSKGKAKLAGTNTLSDKELQSLINRMNMEQQYSKLSKKPSPGRAGAAKVVTDIMTNVGSTLLTNLITNVASRGGNASGTSGYSATFVQPSAGMIGQIRKALK